MNAVRLASRINDRENNLHLMRMVAASMVLVSHSFPLATGNVEHEPLRWLLGMTPGTIAVDVFFVISGLLVTQSLDRRQNLISFVRARVTRIWPGLTAALVLTVLVLGVIFTTLPLREYLSDRQTWKHLVLNLGVVYRVEYYLPGVFADNPHPRAINGSLWTLRWEVYSYGILLLFWLLGEKLSRLGGGSSNKAFIRLVAIGLTVTLSLHLWSLQETTFEKSPPYARLFSMFFMGSMAYFLRHWLPLSRRLGLGAALCLLFLSPCQSWFGYIYTFLLPWIVVQMAYARLPVLNAYNRLGDYSYGIYIYAYPLQQLVASVWPGCSVPFLMGVSGFLTLCMASLSWHVIEKPALRWEKARQRTQGQVGV